MEIDKIYQGDCLEVLKTFEDNSIDLTVTSPPYDNLRTYGGVIDGWSFEKFQGIAKELYRVTKEGGVVSPTVDINNENNVLVDSQNPQTVDVTFTKAEE